MKVLISILLFVLPMVVGAQDTTYYVNHLTEPGPKSEEFKTRVEVRNLANNWKYVRMYSNDTLLDSEGAYSVFPGAESQKEGIHKRYKLWEPSETGLVWYQETYKANETQKLESFYPSGKLKRVERYINGIFESGECFNEDGNERPFTRFFRQPSYPGGDEAMYSFISNNMNYPAKAIKKNIQGLVNISFVVNKDGNISDVTAINEADPILVKEATRLVNSMPLWRSGIVDDRQVKVRYTLPIKFKLE